MVGTLHLCATPIGNLSDASPRLKQVLEAVSVVYAEDTRRSQKLLDFLGVRAQLRSHFSGNESQRSAEIAQHLASGSDVAILTDAGMPVVSDPGAAAVDAAWSVGASVSVVPGPSAATSALAVSGFGGDRFVFEGFLPRKQSDRQRRLRSLAGEERTIVLFATPHRLRADLSELEGHFGPDRRICIARELTKLHEEVSRTTIGEASTLWADREPRGEYTLVVEGMAAEPLPLTQAVTIGRRYMAEGRTRSAAARAAAHESGQDRRQIYEGIGQAES